MNEIDPVQFGRLLERMDNQDEMLTEMLTEMKAVKTDIHSLKAAAAKHEEHRDRHSKYASYFWSFVAFALGNLIQVWIFRGPGHS